MCKNQGTVSKFDMSSVRAIFTGAAPLGAEIAEELQKIYPSWKIRQGYGKLLSLHPLTFYNYSLLKCFRFDRDFHSSLF